MDDEAHQRLVWIRLFEKAGDAGLVCRRCGIMWPTLRKWLTQFRLDGEAGLVAQSRRPKHVSNQKLFRKERALILKLRRQNNLGARRIQTELRLHHEMDLSSLSLNLRRPLCSQTRRSAVKVNVTSDALASSAFCNSSYTK